MDLVNRSGFSAAWIPWKIRPPVWSMVVVVKGTFRIVPDGPAVPAEKPLLPTGNLYVNDDPELPQIYEHDFAPWKPKVDLLLDATDGGTFGVGSWSKRAAAAAQFRPVPQTAPSRLKRAGEPGDFDPEWLKTRWPWWPKNFDWSFYNAAPADQQVESLAGDEIFFFENRRGRLPGLRPRVFTSEKSGFHEIRMILDTLWAKPDAETLALVWRGHRDVRSEKLQDIDHLLVVSEPLGAPARDYREDLEAALAKRREKPEEIPPAPARVPPLPPEPAAVPDVEAQFAEIEKQALEFGKETVPPSPMKPAEIAKAVIDELRRAKEAILAAGKEVPSKLQEAIDSPPKAEDFEIPEVSAEPTPQEPEPPAPPTRADILSRKGALDGLDLTGMDLVGADLSGAKLRGTILRDANLSKANLAGADLSGAVLAHANLSDVVAKGASFQAADLTEVSLRDADLSEAKFEEAILTAADLTGAKLALADASDADLSKANLTGVDARKARFARAMMPQTRLEAADFSGANLSGAGLMNAEGARAKFEGADLTELKAAGAKLPELDARRARADGSVWESADLSKANFSFAQLKKAEFSSARLAEAKFVSANPREGRFVEADLRKADFTRANLFRGSVEKADLTEAILAEANLFEAETWEAVFEKADLRGANVRRTKLALGI